MEGIVVHVHNKTEINPNRIQVKGPSHIKTLEQQHNPFKPIIKTRNQTRLLADRHLTDPTFWDFDQSPQEPVIKDHLWHLWNQLDNVSDPVQGDQRHRGGGEVLYQADEFG